MEQYVLLEVMDCLIFSQGCCMAYSINGDISYILEANSKRPNDFSLIGKKPNEILQFTWKKLMLLKLNSKLNLKFIPKGSKIIKIMKRSKNRRGLTQVKAKKFWYTLTTRKSTLKILFLAVLCTLSIILNILDILNAKSIRKERLSKLSHLSKKLSLFGIQ